MVDKDGKLHCDRCGICIGEEYIEKDPYKWGNKTICFWCLNKVRGYGNGK